MNTFLPFLVFSVTDILFDFLFSVLANSAPTPISYFFLSKSPSTHELSSSHSFLHLFPLLNVSFFLFYSSSFTSFSIRFCLLQLFLLFCSLSSIPQISSVHIKRYCKSSYFLHQLGGIEATALNMIIMLRNPTKIKRNIR